MNKEEGMGFFHSKNYTTRYKERVLRLRKTLLGTHSVFLSKLLKRKYNRMLFKCQSFLPVTDSISNNIVFPHGISGIFISNGATVKSGCVIFHQVTIGSNSLNDSKNKGYPTIGKNCYIGAGAKIIGNVKIGDNVRIGANAVVTKDVPDNSTVVGANCRIIEHNHKLDNSFIPYKKD